MEAAIGSIEEALGALVIAIEGELRSEKKRAQPIIKVEAVEEAISRVAHAIRASIKDEVRKPRP